jgi:hypothetical protein
VAGRVEADAGPGEHGRCRGPGAAAERPDPGHELDEGERLAQVVVGAQGQAMHPVGHLAGRGQHQHPRLGVRLDHRPAHDVAVDHRQIAIEHHDVIGVRGQAFQRDRSVAGDVDREPLLPQTLGDGVGEQPFVLDDEHPHRGLLLRPERRCARR